MFRHPVITDIPPLFPDSTGLAGIDIDQLLKVWELDSAHPNRTMFRTILNTDLAPWLVDAVERLTGNRRSHGTLVLHTHEISRLALAAAVTRLLDQPS